MSKTRQLLHEKIRAYAEAMRRSNGGLKSSNYERLMDWAGEAAFLCILPARMAAAIEKLEAELRQLKGEPEPEKKVPVMQRIWTPDSGEAP